MNELLFLFHAVLTTLFILIALRQGREWLMATTLLQWVFANLFVLKQIDLFGLTATASDAFAISGSIGIALLNEFYGKKAARKAVWMGFYALMIFAAMSWIQTRYMPSDTDTMHVHYLPILTSMPRLVVASLMAYLLSELFNVRFSAFLKQLMQARYVTLRVIVVVALSQLIDTVLFTVVGLMGIMSFLTSVMIVSFTVKCIALALCTPLLAWVKRYVSFSV